jgi:hypothetical protein
VSIPEEWIENGEPIGPGHEATLEKNFDSEHDPWSANGLTDRQLAERTYRSLLYMHSRLNALSKP